MRRTILALAGILAAIAPVVIKGMAYTHFVTPDGSSTSACTQREPCSLTRAVSLIGSKDMPPGSTVLVQHGADGVYSQAGLTFAGSGTAGNPIKFVGEHGVRLTAARVKPDPSAWTLVPGRTYTYQLDWDEVAQFAAMPVQRPPVANWRPIWVEDRRPPFTTPSSRRFDMWFPPLYSARSSIKEVEAQAGTAWSDTANNKVYVHLFDDTAPPRDGTNLYLMSAGWGAVTINGDYLWLENLTIEHATPEGLRVNTSATGTVLKRITALAAIVNLRGTNTAGRGSQYQPRHSPAHGSHGVLRRQPRLRRRRVLERECHGTGPGHRRRGRRGILRPGREAGVRAPLVEWRRHARCQYARTLVVLGIPESHAVGQRERRGHPPQRLSERSGLHLLRAQCL